MAHPHRKLTPFGRYLLVHRITELGWTVSAAAASAGVSRETAYKWLHRWEAEHTDGLRDRTARPHRSPRRTPPVLVKRLLQLRRRHKWGPHRLGPLLGLARSTVYAILRREGVARLRDADRTTGIPIRYVREHPGELLHLDMKPLARIPAGGGHRKLGRSPQTRARRGAGYEIVHVAVDDASRLAFVQILPNDRGGTVAQFLFAAAAFFADRGIQIQRVLTDRAYSYTLSRDFRQTVQTLHARHLVTRPYRPQTNGKAERFIATLLTEWAYARLYRSNEERVRALPKWLHHYNHQRPHTALGGQTPAARSVNNVYGNHS
jgi:transposase InsO family protein